MTIGELAKLVNGERNLNADLHVVEMNGWKRGEWFDETGLPWKDPSPNIGILTRLSFIPRWRCSRVRRIIRSAAAPRLPFELIGAAWIRGEDLAGRLHAKDIPGVRYAPARFTPESSNLSGQEARGVAVYRDRPRHLFSVTARTRTGPDTGRPVSFAHASSEPTCL